MLRLKLDRHRAGEDIEETVGVLIKGGIVAYPTETFYGLGAKFDILDSLKKLYEIKKRPGEKAMPVVIGDKSLLSELVAQSWLENMPQYASELIERFWPGPLTLLLPAREDLSEHLTGNTNKIAVRVPGKSFALDLARKAGFPITATSANISGMPPAADADSVIKYFDENIDILADGGPAPGGMPSTIVDLSEGMIKLVRRGAVSLPL